MKTKGYLRHLLKQHRAIAVLYFVISLIAYPVSLLFQSISKEPLRNLEYAPVSLAIVMVALGAVTPFIIYSFIYDKNKMDTYFSLPIRRDKLFLTHFLFSWLIQIIPMLISNFLAFLIVNFITPNYLLLEFGPYTFTQFLTWSGIMIIGSVILQIPSLLAILCTTNLFNGFVYALVLHFVPSTIQAVWNSSTTGFFGYTPAREFGNYGLTKLEFHSVYVLSTAHEANGEYLTSLIIWFVIALALLALGTWLFKTHQVERTNTTYMVKGFYPAVIATYGILLLLILLNNSFDYIFVHASEPFYLNITFISIFLVAFVVLFIVEIIRFHGLPKIGRTIVFYLLLFAVALGLSFFLNVTVDAHLTRKMPNRSKVDKIELTSAYYQESEYVDSPSIFVYPFGLVTNYSQETVEDDAAVDEIMAIHKEMADAWLKMDHSDLHEDRATFNQPHLRLVYLDSEGDELMVRTLYVYSLKHRSAIEDISGIDLISPHIDKEVSW